MTPPFKSAGVSSGSLLDRGDPSGSSPALTPIQAQVDQIVTDFTHHATDWKALAAMTAGGMAYRWGRVGVLSVSANSASLLRGLATGTGRLASLGIGLGTEVTAFEMTNRSLSSLSGEANQNPNLWKWNGTGGIRQGLLSSLITFGSLKGAGKLAQGENIVVQHLLQDTGMVLGHQLSFQAGIGPKPEGTLAEQFFHAEVTNLQLAAATALGHGLTGGRLLGIERSLDLAVSSKWDLTKRGKNGLSLLDPSLAMAMAGDVPNEKVIPTIVRMLSLGGKGKEAGRPEAVNPHEARKPENGPWVSRSRQVSLGDPSFPKKVIRAIQKSILRSNGDAFEHGVLALQAGDKLLVHEEDITSHHPKEVGGESFKKALLSLMARARLIMADDRQKPVRIFMFHTHPKQDPVPGSFAQTPIYEHEDGEAFTHINGQDIKAAENILEVMAPYLRKYNFTGPIEIVAGAVPARTGMDSRNPYIATYTRTIEAGEGIPGRDLKVKIVPHLGDRLGDFKSAENGPPLYMATVVENLPSDPASPKQVRITFVGNPSKGHDPGAARKVYSLTLNVEDAKKAGVIEMESDVARLKYSYLPFELQVSEGYPFFLHQDRPVPGDSKIDHPIFVNEWCWNISSQRFMHLYAQLDPSIYDFKEEVRPGGPVTVVTGPNHFHIEIWGGTSSLITVFPS